MAEGAPRNNDGRYALDIRAFLAIVTLTVTASFIAGLTMVPTEFHSMHGGSTDSGSSQTVPVRDHFVNNVSLKHSQTMEDEHRPSGQHLLVDIKGVNGDFLNSEERLSKALVNTVKEAGYVRFAE